MPPASAPNFREWKEDVLDTASDRFERRLAEEMGTLRVEMTRGFAELRTEFRGDLATLRADFTTHRGEVRTELAALRGEVRTDLASTRSDLIKWSFVFWAGQVVAMAGILAFMLRDVAPR
jgi:hypothetical protein